MAKSDANILFINYGRVYFSRYLYYMGRIRALQLQYTEAANFFQLSLRKAPQDSAIGFKQNVNKWVVVISLLRGEIPERGIFRMSIHRATLAPYLQLTHGKFLSFLGFERVASIPHCSGSIGRHRLLQQSSREILRHIRGGRDAHAYCSSAPKRDSNGNSPNLARLLAYSD